MPEIDYSKTVIYKIKCKQCEIKPVLFGHTTSIYKCKYEYEYMDMYMLTLTHT